MDRRIGKQGGWVGLIVILLALGYAFSTNRRAIKAR